MNAEELIRKVYDPTLDPSATPQYMDVDLADYEPVEEADRVHVNDGALWFAVERAGKKPRDAKVLSKSLRVLLDGRMVRGAFEASKSGGWVRFLAMRDGKPFSHRLVDPNSSGGAVTGIAFGAVSWVKEKHHRRKRAA